jgi:hypothetical protein
MYSGIYDSNTSYMLMENDDGGCYMMDDGDFDLSPEQLDGNEV